MEEASKHGVHVETYQTTDYAVVDVSQYPDGSSSATPGSDELREVAEMLFRFADHMEAGDE